MIITSTITENYKNVLVHNLSKCIMYKGEEKDQMNYSYIPGTVNVRGLVFVFVFGVFFRPFFGLSVERQKQNFWGGRGSPQTPH